MQLQLKHKSISLLTLLLISLSFISCKVQLIAPYDDGIMQQIETTAKEIDRFYLIMLEGTKEAEGERQYKFLKISNILFNHNDVAVQESQGIVDLMCNTCGKLTQ